MSTDLWTDTSFQRDLGAMGPYEFQQKSVWTNPLVEKNPRVRKIFVRNSGAGNGCANFMDAWKKASVLQEKPMSIKFLVLGGGGGILGFWGGSANFIFMGARIFLISALFSGKVC